MKTDAKMTLTKPTAKVRNDKFPIGNIRTSPIQILNNIKTNAVSALRAFDPLVLAFHANRKGHSIDTTTTKMNTEPSREPKNLPDPALLPNRLFMNSVGVTTTAKTENIIATMLAVLLFSLKTNLVPRLNVIANKIINISFME